MAVDGTVDARLVHPPFKISVFNGNLGCRDKENISLTVRKHYCIEENDRQVTACLKNGGLILKLKI